MGVCANYIGKGRWNQVQNKLQSYGSNDHLIQTPCTKSNSGERESKCNKNMDL
jgi:hypothetical protein